MTLSLKDAILHVLTLRGELCEDLILKAGSFLLLLGNCWNRLHFKFEVKRLKRAKFRDKYEILGRWLPSRGEVYQHFIFRARALVFVIHN